jgi:hypothetical protein
MDGKARILPWITLLGCLVIVAGSHLAIGAEPATSQGPALNEQRVAGDASIASDQAATSANSGAAQQPEESDDGAPDEAPAANEEPSASEDSPASQDPAARDASRASEESDAGEEGGTTEASDAEPSAQGEKPAEVERPARPPLSPEMIALGDKVRAALALLARQPLNTRDNTPGQAIQLSLAFGCDASLGYNGPSGKRINAIGCLCWNYPCAGYRLLQTRGSQVMARVGYALQAQPSQFLAVLALSRVPEDYQIRVGEYRGTVADLIEFEKRNCPGGADLSFTLIGLAHYLDDEQTWSNDRGEQWSVDRLVRKELARSTSTSDRDATDRLMGLSYALYRRKKEGRPIDGAFESAQEYLDEFHQYALALQNPDGTWHPGFFAHKGTSNDKMGTLRSTGHILRWLVFSLPQDRLEDPRVVRSVAYLATVLGSQRSRGNVASMSMRDLEGVMHAAHALSIYDGRVFKSRGADRPAAGSQVVASRTTPE